MDYGRTAELELRIRHRHTDGTWGAMEPRVPPDPADRDPEREWATGTIYACTECDEQIEVEEISNPAGPG